MKIFEDVEKWEDRMMVIIGLVILHVIIIPATCKGQMDNVPKKTMVGLS